MLIFKKLLDFHAKTNQEPHLKMCVFHFSEKNPLKEWHVKKKFCGFTINRYKKECEDSFNKSSREICIVRRIMKNENSLQQQLFQS